MDNWTRYFSQRILDRGREYYKSGKVKGYVSTEDSCIARVLGTHVYNVIIQGFKTGRLRVTCDCPYAGDGMLCKHAAAVLFKRQEEQRAGVIEDLSYSLKTDPEKNYFSIGPILRKHEVGENTIQEAMEIVESGDLTIERHSLGYATTGRGQELVISFGGKLQGNREYPVSVSVFLTKDRLLSKDCYALHDSSYRYSYYDYNYNQLCSHVVALLLLADEYIAKYNPGDDTDYLGSQMLKSYRKLSSLQKIDTTTEKEKVVRLEPKLTLGDRTNFGKLNLSFKIGKDKLYALRNISELMEKRENAEGYKLGKNNMISFMDEDFDEESKGYYELMDKARANAELIAQKVGEIRGYYSGEGTTIKDKLELSAEILDKFYEMAYGRTIDFDEYARSYGASELKRIKLADGKLNIDISIQSFVDDTLRNNYLFDEDNSKTMLTRPAKASGKAKNSKTAGAPSGLHIIAHLPDIYKGKDYNYIIDKEKGTFSRIADLSPIASMLIQNARDNFVQFRIGKNNISEFYYRMLPQMIEAPEITIDEDYDDIKNIIPPECEIIFYLDADEDNIKGRVSAKYADEEHFLHQLTEEDYPLPAGRDSSFEQEAVATLIKFLPETGTAEDTFYAEKTGDAIFDILSSGLKEMMAIGEIKATKDFERLKIRKAPHVKLGVSVESGILNLDVTTDDMTQDELLDLLESYRQKKKFFRLRNGEFIQLEKDDTIEELLVTMEAMGVSAKEFTKGKLHLPLYRAIYINKLLEEHDDIAAERDKNFKNLVRNFNSVKESEIEVPDSLSGVLRGYQEYGFKWLSTLSELGFGGILADDMGLGKTLQVITFLLSRIQEAREQKKKLTALIVCPASLVYNWEEEFKKFAPSIKVKTVAGSQTERKKILSSKTRPEVMVTSYDLLKRDIGSYESLEFDYEIIDEAQFIKNASAAVSKSVKIINSKTRFALTGTPIENRLSELWSIFDYLMPGFLYTYDRFRSDFENAITKYKDEAITKQLRNMVGPFILRRLKENVLKDLPDKMEEVRFSRFEPAQRKLYDAQVTHMKKMLESEDYKSGKDRIKILAELTRIRQICCDPELITAGYKGESAKRASCIELIQSAIDGGHKILLFSQFTSMFELLEKDLQKLGIEFYKITGETSKEDRIRLVHAFNENEVPLFLISLKAGGTGLNLVGADVVIHYDPWWNLAAQNQATDRAHRIGQTKKVSVFKLIVKDTIEEKIIDMQNAKKDLADAILSGESKSLMNMSKEQLMELLG
nr:DEAD/DEAH box helicase [uncultured Butyrivibrio sp.]